jgi:hypothetical protein
VKAKMFYRQLSIQTSNVPCCDFFKCWNRESVCSCFTFLGDWEILFSSFFFTVQQLAHWLAIKSLAMKSWLKKFLLPLMQSVAVILLFAFCFAIICGCCMVAMNFYCYATVPDMRLLSIALLICSFFFLSHARVLCEREKAEGENSHTPITLHLCHRQ